MRLRFEINVGRGSEGPVKGKVASFVPDTTSAHATVSRKQAMMDAYQARW
jgi:hypothetical protein